MTRLTQAYIDKKALMHNINQVKALAPHSQIIAMLKANAYGCGLSLVAPLLAKEVYAFGLACLEEALAIKALGLDTRCILFQGVFSEDEINIAAEHQFQLVIHAEHQLSWLLATPLKSPLRVWVKVNTGMHRLGFMPEALQDVLNALATCAWVDKDIGIITHLACADEPENSANDAQLNLFNALISTLSPNRFKKSIANSAAIITRPDTRLDFVRPGIMLYGVSPFFKQTGIEIGLLPVMHFISCITAIHHCKKDTSIGYGASFKTKQDSIIAVVSVGYADGYPRHIEPNTPVWVAGKKAPIVGRVSMDMLTIDITDCPDAEIGSLVELWGANIAVEQIAKCAKTSPYELLTQFAPRSRSRPSESRPLTFVPKYL